MKDLSNKPISEVDEKVRLPWEAELEVKDLIKPITLRRIRILQVAGMAILALLLGGAAWWFWVKPPSGERMIENMITAVGGLEGWKSINNGSFVRTHRLYDENGKVIRQNEETLFFQNAEGGKNFLIRSRTNEGNDVVIGRDGGGYWASLNGSQVDPVTLSKDLEFMCDGDHCGPLCASEMALYRLSLPFKLADGGVIARNAGTAVLNGEKAQLLDVTFDPSVGKDRWVFYVDPSTRYIRKMEHFPSVKENVQPEEIFLSDFKKEGAIVLSHSNKYYRSNGKILEEFLFSDVKFNTDLPSDLFQRPKQLATRD